MKNGLLLLVLLFDSWTVFGQVREQQNIADRSLLEKDALSIYRPTLVLITITPFMPRVP